MKLSRIFHLGAILIQDGKLYRSGVKRLGPDLDRALRRTNDYRNKILEINKNKQTKYREIRRRHVPQLEVLEAKLDELDKAREEALEEIRVRRRTEHATRLTAYRKALAKYKKNKEGKEPKPPKRERKQYEDIEVRLDDIVEKRRPLQEEIKTTRQPFDKLIEKWKDQWGLQAETIAVERGYGCWKEKKTKKGEIKRTYDGHDNHGKGRVNAEVTASMLADPAVPEAWKEIHRSEQSFDAELKAERKKIDISSGTKGLTEKAVKSAVSNVARIQRTGVFAELKFRRYEEEGRLGIHFSKGITWDELCEAPGSFSIRRRGEKGRFSHEAYDCMMPLTRGSKPKLAHFLLVEDRPVPPRAKIKDLWILATKRGVHTTFELQLSCEVLPEDVVREKGKRGTAALHLAYRSTAKGDIRVAWLDADVPIPDHNGNDLRGPICIPAKARVDAESGPEFRSHQDMLWDMIQPTAIEWLKTAPEDVQEDCKNIEKWRNPIRLVWAVDKVAEERLGKRRKVLWRQWLDECIPKRPPRMNEKDWRKKRKEESADLFGEIDTVLEWARANNVTDAYTLILDWWARKHVHLVDVGGRRSTRGLAHRDDWFRVVVARTRLAVANIVVDDQDLRAAAKKASSDAASSEELPAPVRGQRTSAAPGRLRALMVEVFGDDAKKVGIDGMAKTCHECSAEVRKSNEVHVECGGGHSFDRDWNITRQMLQREWSGDSKPPRPARSKKHRQKKGKETEKVSKTEVVGHAAE